MEKISNELKNENNNVAWLQNIINTLRKMEQKIFDKINIVEEGDLINNNEIKNNIKKNNIKKKKIVKKTSKYNNFNDILKEIKITKNKINDINKKLTIYEDAIKNAVVRYDRKKFKKTIKDNKQELVKLLKKSKKLDKEKKPFIEKLKKKKQRVRKVDFIPLNEFTDNFNIDDKDWVYEKPRDLFNFKKCRWYNPHDNQVKITKSNNKYDTTVKLTQTKDFLKERYLNVVNSINKSIEAKVRNNKNIKNIDTKKKIVDMDVETLKNFRYQGKSLEEIIEKVRLDNKNEGKETKVQMHIAYLIYRVTSKYDNENKKYTDEYDMSDKYFHYKHSVVLLNLDMIFDIHSIINKVDDNIINKNPHIGLTKKQYNLDKAIRGVMKGEEDEIQEIEDNPDSRKFDYLGFLKFEITLFKYKPIWTGLYTPTPEIRVPNTTFINIKNIKSESNQLKKYNEGININGCLIYCYAYHLFKKNFSGKNATRDAENVIKYIINFGEKKSIIESVNNIETNKTVFHEGITFPIKFKQLNSFEKQNNISINVYSYIKSKDNINIYEKLYKSTENFPDKMNLLYVEKDENDLLISHFIYINKYDTMFGFLENQSKHFKICDICMCPIYKDFDKHIEICNKINTTGKNYQAIKVFPKIKDSWHVNEFTDYSKMIEVLTVVTSDFESLLLKKNQKIGDNSEIIEHHSAFMYGLCQITKKYENTYENEKLTSIKRIDYKTKTNQNSDEDLLLIDYMNDLFNLYDESHKHLVNSCNEQIFLTKEDEENYKNALNCYLCDESLLKDGKVDKCRDHCHYTGKYLGCAHNSCNMKRQIKKCRYDCKGHFNDNGEHIKNACKYYNLPIVLHNMTSYDSKYIIRAIYLHAKKNNIDLSDKRVLKFISKSNEKISSIYYRGLYFIDSFCFIASSLDSISSKLKNEDKNATYDNFMKFKNERNIENISFDEFNYKLLFPYSYIDNIEKLNETNLPDKKYYYNVLKNESENDEKFTKICNCNNCDVCKFNKDYNKTIELYNKLKCKNIGDFYDIYLKNDVTLLADSWLNFAENCQKYYGLEINYFVSGPQYFNAANYYMNKLKTYNISEENSEIYHIFKSMMRGGQSFVGQRYEESIFDSENSENNRYIIQPDANSLYASIMTRKLPNGKEFKILENDSEEFKTMSDKNTIKNFDFNGDYCYLYTVDLDYSNKTIGELIKNGDLQQDYDIVYNCKKSDNLHDIHNYYPLAVEKREVLENEISDYQKKCYKEINDGKEYKKSCKKLVGTFYNKIEYTCTIENLAFYLKHGLRILKIHKIVKCSQSELFTKFVNFNLDKRNEAKLLKNLILAELFKIAVNSIYGKTLQDPCKNRPVSIVNSEKSINKALVSAYTKSLTKVFDEFYLKETHKQSDKINTPMFVGCYILELSKLVLYRFYYEVILKKYSHNNVKILMSDTDSLALSISCKNIYEDIVNDDTLNKHFDYSGYEKTHPCYNLLEQLKINDNEKYKRLMKNTGKFYCFKDEACSYAVKTGYFLKSKCYFIKYDCSKDYYKIRNKGVNNHINKTEIKEINYKEAIHENKTVKKDNKRICSKKMVNYTINQNKMALNAFNDKYYQLKNGIDGLSFGHYKINNDKNNIDNSDNNNNISNDNNTISNNNQIDINNIVNNNSNIIIRIHLPNIMLVLNIDNQDFYLLKEKGKYNHYFKKLNKYEKKIMMSIVGGSYLL